MDFTTAVSIISKDLEEAGKLLDQLSTTTMNNMAELRLARSRVRSAAEMVAVLPELAGEAGPKADIAAMTEAVAETEFGAKAEFKAAEKIRKVAAEPKVVAAVEIREVVAAGPGPEVMADIKPAVKEEAVVEIKAEVAKTQEPVRTPESNKSILADRFSGSDRLVQQVSSVRQDAAISSAMHAMPITDIAAAIGINDKFYFIRELFSGDGKAYVDTIRRLNSAASLGEAMRILDESTVMGSDPAAQSSFVDVVRRKFNING